MRPGGKSNGVSPFFETPNLSFEGRDRNVAHLVVPQPAEAEVADPSKLVETHKYLNKHKCPVADFLFRLVVTNRVDTLATCQPYR